MASPTQWTWVWVNSGSWWWTRRPGVLQSMGSQRVGHDWVTELNWTECLLPGRMKCYNSLGRINAQSGRISICIEPSHRRIGHDRKGTHFQPTFIFLSACQRWHLVVMWHIKEKLYWWDTSQKSTAVFFLEQKLMDPNCPIWDIQSQSVSSSI